MHSFEINYPQPENKMEKKKKRKRKKVNAYGAFTLSPPGNCEPYQKWLAPSAPGAHFWLLCGHLDRLRFPPGSVHDRKFGHKIFFITLQHFLSPPTLGRALAFPLELGL